MSDSSQSSIRFYFSFRSPYAWLAAERLDSELGDLGVPIERIPIFPTPKLFPNDPSAIPNKEAYLAQDIPRLARERGLSVRFPSSTDTDWALSHAAFLGARDQETGQRFMLAVFRKRFCEGLDLGEDAVVADAARAAGLDPDTVLAAGHSEALRADVSDGWRLAVERDRIFGVPSFVFAGKLYWGQDRMHFLRSAVARKTDAAQCKLPVHPASRSPNKAYLGVDGAESAGLGALDERREHGPNQPRSGTPGSAPSAIAA